MGLLRRIFYLYENKITVKSVSPIIFLLFLPIGCVKNLSGRKLEMRCVSSVLRMSWLCSFSTAMANVLREEKPFILDSEGIRTGYIALEGWIEFISNGNNYRNIRMRTPLSAMTQIT